MFTQIPESMGFMVNLIVLISGTFLLVVAVAGCLISGCFRKHQPLQPSKLGKSRQS